MILDIKEVLERKKSCMDVTTGLTIDNENEAIRSFLDFVLSPRGQVIFEKLGFVAEKN